MSEYSLSTVNQDTVSSFLSLNMSAERKEYVTRRLEEGSLRYEQMYLFSNGRKVAAAFNFSPAPILVPHISFDITEATLTSFADTLKDFLVEQDAVKKILIVDSNLAPLSVVPFLVQAGWTVDSHDKLYQTDLNEKSWQTADEVTEYPASALLSTEMRDFYQECLQTDRVIGDTGTRDPSKAFENNLKDDTMRLFVMKQGGKIIAAATLASMTPNQASIHLLGVIPAQRGNGIGTRLHAHVLAMAKESMSLHIGGTRADNLPMQAIYQGNGATLLAEHYQLKLVSE